VYVRSTQIEPYHFKFDTADGIKIIASFSIEGLPQGREFVPFKVLLAESLADDWRLADVSGTVDAPQNNKRDADVSFDKKELREQRAPQFDLMKVKPGEAFTLKLLLHPRDNKKPDRPKAIDLLRTDGKAFRLEIADSGSSS
jgi:hypothetical protein